VLEIVTLVGCNLWEGFEPGVKLTDELVRFEKPRKTFRHTMVICSR